LKLFCCNMMMLFICDDNLVIIPKISFSVQEPNDYHNICVDTYPSFINIIVIAFILCSYLRSDENYWNFYEYRFFYECSFFYVVFPLVQVMKITDTGRHKHSVQETCRLVILVRNVELLVLIDHEFNCRWLL